MIRKISFSIIIGFAFVFISCHSLSEQDKQYVGDWKLCYQEDLDYSPQRNGERIDTFSLKDDGTWQWGRSTGEWEGSTPENSHLGPDNPYRLRFEKVSVYTPHSGEMTGFDAFITELAGVAVLQFDLHYKYKALGMYDHPLDGAFVADKFYKTKTSFYFFRNESDKEKLANYFKEKEYRNWLDFVDKRFGDVNFRFTPSVDSLYEIDKIWTNYNLKDTGYVKNICDAIEYGKRSGLTNSIHLRLLSIIRMGPVKLPEVQTQVEENEIAETATETEE